MEASSCNNNITNPGSFARVASSSSISEFNHTHQDELVNPIATPIITTTTTTSTTGTSTSISSHPPNPTRFAMPSASTIFRAPLSAFLEYSGLLRPSSSSSSHSAPHRDADPFLPEPHNLNNDSHSNDAQVSIHIVPAADIRHSNRDSATGLHSNIEVPGDAAGTSQGSMGSQDREGGDGVASNTGNSSHSTYDIQQAAKWLEQFLPFSLLLIVVFIRQHLQGFFLTIWIAVVMFKSNDIMRNQTALKGERKTHVLIGISLAFMLHVVGVYWWCNNNDLLYPLIMLPPKPIPRFWHAIFIILVNDTLARQASLVLKCFLLMYFKNSRGRNYRKQGQMLTLVEYFTLLYRTLLPTPVWYRFFLNKEYGSLFSSLMTGLYLTFKLKYVVEKVQSFVTALKALLHKEVHYGAYATSEQVMAAGDLCAICQEKLFAPVTLCCNHIFCEDCASEWFERERTCPLCRALVKPADMRSFGDGSTSLSYQIF